MPPISEIVAQLSLDEKIHVMSGNATWASEGIGLLKRGKKGVYNYAPYHAGGVDRLKIPAVKFVDGPRGVVCGNSSCFPVAMARGASWDVELEEAIGSVIGQEIRAHGGNYFGGVCINLLRHPAWGRAQETYGEDPCHVGALGAALTRGVQQHNVIACVKHFALNSMENMRFKVDVTVDERTLREVYLPHFKQCIVEANAASVMSAYNKVNGTYCGENGHLLNTILREEWGFTGFVVSDFVWGTHDAARSINNGLDIEMHIKRKFKAIKAKIKAGELSEAQLDQSVTRIIRTLLEFEQRTDPQQYPAALIASQDKLKLTQIAAEKSMVLLQNANQTLPFRPNEIKTVAVIGALATKPNLGDHGSSLVRPPDTVSALDGIQSYFAGTTVDVRYDNGSNLKRAQKVAAAADVVVIVAGNDATHEGEYVINSPLADNQFLRERGIAFGGDRDDLSLRKAEIDLVNAIADVQSKVCVALVGGSAITVEAWKDNVPAILMMWYAGMRGGTALASILFGDTNPSGKLPFSIVKNTKDLVPFDKKATAVTYDYLHGYSFLDQQRTRAAFCFGHGLSYANFAYSNFEIQHALIRAEDTINCSVTVSNTSEIDGEEVVQLYYGCEDSAVIRAHKKLLAFHKRNIPAGQTLIFDFAIPASKLAYYDVQSGRWVVEFADYQLYVGGSSDAAERMTINVAIQGA